jgi:lipoprotein NlpI
LELCPDCEEARILLAAMPLTVPDGLTAGTLDDALADLDHTITLAPNRADYHTKRGLVLLAMKQPKDALEEFDKSLALMPDKNLNAWLHRGQAWFALDQPRKALEDYNRILGVNPLWLPALTERGRVRLSLGEFDQAQRDYERALRSGDHSVNTILMAGMCAIQLGKDDHALEIFVEAEKNNRAGPDCFELRGLTYAGLERWPAALADYTQAIERRPGIGRLYFYRCVAEARLNRMDEALADALKGLAAKDVEPNFRLQLALLAQGWLREQGRDAEARSLLAKQRIETGGAWPASVVRFLRGEMTWTELQRSAGNDAQRSEAYAYAGWSDLLEGRLGTGREKLQWVIAHADKKVLEYELARRLLALETRA